VTTSATSPATTTESTAARILDAATAEFFEHGFHGASLRDLAARAGIRSATLYYHFANKEDLLVAIMRTTLDDLTADVEAAIAQQSTAVDRLAAAVRAHIRFHVARHREVFLCDAELRALSPENRADVVALRDRYEAIFRRILRDGAADGALDVPNVDLVTRSLLASCTGVAFWFRPTGPMTVDGVADGYVELFLRALGAAT
jgi:AcrR family transcriptional regulator